MSWPCFPTKSIRRGDWEPTEGGGRKRECFYTLPDGREVRFNDLPPGAMWNSSQQPEGTYLAGRNSIMVVLPSRVIWPMNDAGSDGCRWQVSGEIPNVTASPSINYVGRYHGWVQNGVVSDDCEGRKFDAMGNPIR